MPDCFFFSFFRGSAGVYHSTRLPSKSLSLDPTGIWKQPLRPSADLAKPLHRLQGFPMASRCRPSRRGRWQRSQQRREVRGQPRQNLVSKRLRLFHHFVSLGRGRLARTLIRDLVPLLAALVEVLRGRLFRRDQDRESREQCLVVALTMRLVAGSPNDGCGKRLGCAVAEDEPAVRGQPCRGGVRQILLCRLKKTGDLGGRGPDPDEALRLQESLQAHVPIPSGRSWVPSRSARRIRPSPGALLEIPPGCR